MRVIFALAMAALLAGCNATSGNNVVTVPANANAKPQGKYRISVGTTPGLMMRSADGTSGKLYAGAIYEPGITVREAKARRDTHLPVLRRAISARCASVGGKFGEGESVKFQKGAWTIAGVCFPR